MSVGSGLPADGVRKDVSTDFDGPRISVHEVEARDVWCHVVRSHGEIATALVVTGRADVAALRGARGLSRHRDAHRLALASRRVAAGEVVWRRRADVKISTHVGGRPSIVGARAGTVAAVGWASATVAVAARFRARIAAFAVIARSTRPAVTAGGDEREERENKA